MDDATLHPPVTRRLATSIGGIAIAGLASVLAYAPFDQFYLAWIAAVPVLWLVANSRTAWSAAGTGFAFGLVYFGTNLWYLWYIGPLPLLGAVLYLALFPMMFAVFWRPMARRRDVWSVVTAAAMWVAIDWLRAVLPFGLPYVFLGHAQSPMLAMTQIADIAGVYGITFWVLLVNGIVWLAIEHRGQKSAWSRSSLRHPERSRGTSPDGDRADQARSFDSLRSLRMTDQGAPCSLLRSLTPTLAMILATTIALASYGTWRLAERDFKPGPNVALLQPHFELLNTEPVDGAALIQWLAAETSRAVTNSTEPVDLVVWPESSVSSLNEEARREMAGSQIGQVANEVHTWLSTLSSQGPDLLVGASAREGITIRDNRYVADDRFNSVFHYTSGGVADARYDKAHLFPFGEYIPFGTQPWPIVYLHDFFQLFNPWGGDHELTPGTDDTVFTIAGSRVIAPICFEDIVPPRVRDLAYDGTTKRADVLVNVTNDGWFRGNQMAQHLQAASFRSIENRIPTARSVNNGVSAIVDPDGRIRSSVPAATPGSLVGRVMLDDRTAPYGIIGDVFAYACVAATTLITLIRLIPRRTAS
ncbi:MAG: apolipoprotein N-acyltransferase [Planctomycetota bacterium]